MMRLKRIDSVGSHVKKAVTAHHSRVAQAKRIVNIIMATFEDLPKELVDICTG